MIKLSSYEAVLYDFGNTLADEFYFSFPPPNHKEFTEVIRKNIYDVYYADPSADNLLNQWMIGKISKNEIAKYLAEKSKFSEGQILNNLEYCCKNLKIFGKAMTFAKETTKNTKTAIVTINADIFSETIVPNYKLDESFTKILNSCQHQTLNKLELCKTALKELGDIPIEKSILIDNTNDNCEEFKQAGGSSYLFTDQKQFLLDCKN